MQLFLSLILLPWCFNLGMGSIKFILSNLFGDFFRDKITHQVVHISCWKCTLCCYYMLSDVLCWDGSRCLSLWTLLTSDLLHQDSLGECDRGAAATSIHSHHTDLQTVTGGLVLDNIAAGLLQILIDCFPVLSWMGKLYKVKTDWQFTELLFILIL